MVPMSSGHTLQTADFDPEDMVACYQERELFRPLRRGEWLNRSPLSAKPHCRALGALSDSPERGEGLLSGHGSLPPVFHRPAEVSGARSFCEFPC